MGLGDEVASATPSVGVSVSLGLGAAVVLEAAVASGVGVGDAVEGLADAAAVTEGLGVELGLAGGMGVDGTGRQAASPESAPTTTNFRRGNCMMFLLGTEYTHGESSQT